MIKRLIIAYFSNRFDRRLKKAIRQANEIRKETGYVCLVLLLKKRPTVVRKKDLKNNIKRGVFQKGIGIKELERVALYKTI